MKLTDLIAFCEKAGACRIGVTLIRQNAELSFAELYDVCDEPGWIAWLICRIEVSPGDPRNYDGFAGDDITLRDVDERLRDELNLSITIPWEARDKAEWRDVERDSGYSIDSILEELKAVWPASRIEARFAVMEKRREREEAEQRGY